MGSLAGMAGSLNNLGYVASLQKNFVAAREYYQRGLALERKLESVNYELIALLLEGLAEVCMGEGNAARAVWHWSMAGRIRIEIGVDMPEEERKASAGYLEQALYLLGEGLFASIWAQGQVASIDQIL